MPQLSKHQRTSPSPRPSAKEGGFRLRHVLLLLVLVATGWQAVPRAKAAWTLRERATQFADYALCMVGPSGPQLLRDGSPEFAELVRRRLLMSAPDSKPFAACHGLVSALAPAPVVAAHEAPAGAFIEYGPAMADAHAATDAQTATEAKAAQLGAAPSLALDQLRISSRVLSELSSAAWPFERKGYTRLVRPSSHAKEAQHPQEFAPARVGLGLPGWRGLYRSTWHAAGRWYLAQGHAANLAVFESVDLGSSWRPVSLDQPGLSKHAGRCVAQDSDNAFVFEADRGKMYVHSLRADETQHTEQLAGEFGILSASCDEDSALLALENVRNKAQRLALLCHHAGRCVALPVPPSWLQGSFDLSRIDGVTVSITADRGVVRARSSRDDGRTWTGASVAFDFKAKGAARTDVPMPSRLLKLGKRLLLHGEPPASKTYPLMYSDDYGASWHGADTASKPPLRSDAQLSQRARR